jgi:MSHA biogenesis protein MshN
MIKNAGLPSVLSKIACPALSFLTEVPIGNIRGAVMNASTSPRTGALPQGELEYRKGLAAIEEGRLEDAVAHLRWALRLNPRNCAAWNDLGVVMESLGNPSDARQCYQVTLRIDPNHKDAQSNLASLLLQLDMARALRLEVFANEAAFAGGIH